jgi:hypothetical protein
VSFARLAWYTAIYYGPALPSSIRFIPNRFQKFSKWLYYVDGATPPFVPGTPLTLTQLDPVLSGLPPHHVILQSSRQLCVPVQKNNQVIPASVLNIVRWIDLEKFDLVTSTTITPVTLTLNHINPLLSGLPAETATLTGPLQLGVPVAKNGVIPPAS